MKIPAFKPNDSFLQRYAIPCLISNIKNSGLPGIAARHIIEFKTDPECEIYLCGKKSKQMTAWQREVLEKFFDKEELAAAVQEAMNEYEQAGEAYSDASASERKQIQKHGIATYITISTMVIDDVKRQVLLRARTEVDGHLIEHGITIYLSRGRWRFAEGDHFSRYESALEKYRLSDEDEVGRQAVLEAMKKLERIFPPSTPDAPVETSLAVLEGVWEFDRTATGRTRRQLGYSDEEQLKRDLKYLADQKSYYEFSGGRMQFVQYGSRIVRAGNYKCEREGNRVKLFIFKSVPGLKKEQPMFQTENFWCDGRILVEREGIVFRRK